MMPHGHAVWIGRFRRYRGRREASTRVADAPENALGRHLPPAVGAELHEPHVGDDEGDSSDFRENDFEVFIDPNGDNHEYYRVSEIQRTGNGI